MELIDLAVGCDLHAITLDDSRGWWEKAMERDADVGVCGCCGSPAPPYAHFCRVCERRGGDVGWQARGAKVH